MYCIRYVLLFFLVLLSSNAFAQDDFETLGETGFAVNHKVNSDYKMNFAVRSRYYVYQDAAYAFDFRQIDLAHFSSFNLDYNHSLSLGVQYRFRESIDGGSNELRLTQQFNYTKKKLGVRFGHRVRMEQRILDDFTILRTRYRFALDFPLNGEKLDVGESYLITSLEALLSLSKKIKPEIDQRTTAQIGWLLTEKLKVQLGLEYRFEAFNSNTEERLFILTSIILKV